MFRASSRPSPAGAFEFQPETDAACTPETVRIKSARERVVILFALSGNAEKLCAICPGDSSKYVRGGKPLQKPESLTGDALTCQPCRLGIISLRDAGAIAIRTGAVAA